MKKLLITTLISLLIIPQAFADDTPPPTLNLNYNPPEQQQNQGDDTPPPQLVVEGDFPEDQEPQGEPNNNPPQQEQQVEIVSHSISPRDLNPLTSSANLYYELQGTADIDIKIYNANNQLVQTLVSNNIHGGGEYMLKWYGTVNGQQDGTPLEVGSYSYQIVAKNPLTQDIYDTATGSMRIQYATAQPPQINLNTNNPDDQNQAFIANQNRQTGTTSETGPATLIYLTSPLFAYLYRKKYEK